MHRRMCNGPASWPRGPNVAHAPAPHMARRPLRHHGGEVQEEQKENRGTERSNDGAARPRHRQDVLPRWVRGLWGHHRIVLQAYTITQRESARPEGAPQGNIRSEMDNGDRHVFGEAGGAGGARSHIWCLGGESRRV